MVGVGGGIGASTAKYFGLFDKIYANIPIASQYVDGGQQTAKPSADDGDALWWRSNHRDA
jgi:hypothetical protein